MASPRVPSKTRRAVAEQASGCCEYCKTQERFCPDPFSIEHIIPRSRRGTNRVDNLAYSCLGCNNAKADYVDGRDPFTGEVVRLFNPRIDQWTEHFEWDSSQVVLIGRTAIGRATINRLRLNRSGLQNLREILRAAKLHPPKSCS